MSLETAPYELHPDVVRLDQTDGSCRLLHLGANACALDPDAAEWLNALLASGVRDAAAEIAAQYEDGDAVVVRRDLEAFARDLRKQRLIRPRGRTAVPERIRHGAARVSVQTSLRATDTFARRPSTRVWWLLLIARSATALFGWAATVREWERCYPQPAGKDGAPPDSETNDAVDQAVRQGAAKFPLDAQCKERSLAALGLLRGQGIRAQLVVGISQVPFQGHVWVESGGRVVSDDPEGIRPYEPLLRYG